MDVLVQEGSSPHSHLGTQTLGGSDVFSSSMTAIIILAQRKGKWTGGMYQGDFKDLDRSDKYLLSPALYWR